MSRAIILTLTLRQQSTTSEFRQFSDGSDGQGEDGDSTPNPAGQRNL
jgi:hypothetical protein